MAKSKKTVSKRQSYDDVWKNVSVDGHFKADIPQKMLELFKQEKVQMLTYENSGFSLNAKVRIEAWDREGLERLIRYCSRPCFASENLTRLIAECPPEHKEQIASLMAPLFRECVIPPRLLIRHEKFKKVF